MAGNGKFEKFYDFIGNVAARSTDLIVNDFMEKFRKELKAGFKKIFIRASVKYVIIFLGIFIVILEPFNFFISHMMASVLFIGVFAWSFISFIGTVKKYYKLPYFIIRDKSIHNGTWDFIKLKWIKIWKGAKGYNLVKSVGTLFSGNFESMPEIDDIVKDFLKYILRDVIIFCSFFALYFITVNFLIKPFLLMKFAGLYTWEIYLFPFVQVKDFIFYLIN